MLLDTNTSKKQKHKTKQTHNTTTTKTTHPKKSHQDINLKNLQK